MRVAPIKGNVFVANLPEHCTPGELAALFDEYGLVLGAEIKNWHQRPGQPSCGTVALAPETAVEKAIKSLNGQVVGHLKLAVRRNAQEPKPAAGPKSYDRPVRPPRPSYQAEPAGESFPAPAQPAPTRKVVVEYRTPRRFALPQRGAAGAGSN
jgi:hypothetical protein